MGYNSACIGNITKTFARLFGVSQIKQQKIFWKTLGQRQQPAAQYFGPPLLPSIRTNVVQGVQRVGMGYYRQVSIIFTMSGAPFLNLPGGMNSVQKSV